MSKEKAIYVLEMNNPFLGGKEEQDLSEAMDIAIKAVKDKHCKSAILIPDGATNGDMIKAMFPNARVSNTFPTLGNDIIYYIFIEEVNGITNEMRVMKSWWNAPYKGGKEE